MISSELATVIRSNTLVVRPSGLPELGLRLVTYDMPWWHADPSELESLGISDPYWAFCWPGGMALARFILDRPQLLRGRTVVDFGAGCGVAGLAAAAVGARRIVAADIDPLALWAAGENASLNGLSLETELEDLVGTPLPAVDYLLVGDVTYSREMVERLWPWFDHLARHGTNVLIADPGRGFLPPGVAALTEIELPPESGNLALAPASKVAIYSISYPSS